MIVVYIVVDEMVMAYSQMRIGPLNLGFYGMLSSILNGVNLLVIEFILPKYVINSLLFKCLIVCWLFCVIILFSFIIVISIYLSLIVFLSISGISVVLMILPSFISVSKYSVLGSLRLLSQFISWELLFTTLIILIFYPVLVLDLVMLC